VLSMKPLDYQIKNLWNQALTNEELSAKFKATLKEYLETRDVSYVGEYLRELACYHYLHEFVRKAVVLAIELGEDHVIEAIVKLLAGLNHHYELPKRQVDAGLLRAERYVSDTLKVDVPKAPELLQFFKERLRQVKFIDEE
jgi:MA3 domain